jgi:hypothetical protein
MNIVSFHHDWNEPDREGRRAPHPLVQCRRHVRQQIIAPPTPDKA